MATSDSLCTNLTCWLSVARAQTPVFPGVAGRIQPILNVQLLDTDISLSGTPSVCKYICMYVCICRGETASKRCVNHLLWSTSILYAWFIDRQSAACFAVSEHQVNVTRSTIALCIQCMKWWLLRRQWNHSVVLRIDPAYIIGYLALYVVNTCYIAHIRPSVCLGF